MRRQSSHCCKYLQLYNPYPQHELRSNYGTQRFSKIRGTVMVFYCGWRGRGRESTFVSGGDDFLWAVIRPAAALFFQCNIDIGQNSFPTLE
jgi:hypothetical protein